jgi:uncharacterized protein (TIGR02246 family)
MRNFSVYGFFLVVFFLMGAGFFLANVQETGEKDADYKAFIQLAKDLDEAWNARDAKALANLFTEDADFQFWTGQCVSGRNQIEKYYTSQVFPPMPENFRHSAVIERHRYIKSDVVIGDGYDDIVGTRGEEPFKMHLFFTCVSVKQDGK